MDDYTLCIPCLLGLEGPIAKELRHMGLANVAAENGAVRCTGDAAAVAKVNFGLRMGERALIELGRFPANHFDALFEGVRALPWEALIPANGAFPVTGHCLNAQLHSVPDCQRIIKKAVVERLSRVYGIKWFPEDGPLYQIRFTIMKDAVSIGIDSSGTSLHKRGYRPLRAAAPLRETLAAAMVTLSGYRGKGDFCDPFCGSGTIPIEAALIALNRAPGLNRNFAAMQWPGFDRTIWDNARAEAKAKEFQGNYQIFASDIDPAAVDLARACAKKAGVANLIQFSVADARNFHRVTERGVIVTNPPYGERVMEKKEVEVLYRDFGRALRQQENWKLYLLSAHTEFERCFGRLADKKRKLYNGMKKCDLFMYL